MTGSVVRGEEIESSDVDMSLIVEGNFEGHRRSGVDAWQDGVYVDAITVSKENITGIEKVMQNPIYATHINDGLILYDPTGFLTQMQKEVQAVFMQPKWLGIRLLFWMEKARKSMSGLTEAVATVDPSGICRHAPLLMASLSWVPLLRIGITPSSTRPLVQLGITSAKLKERICEWEGSAKMSADDVLGFLSFITECISLDPSKSGHEKDYLMEKIEWMARNGLPQEALHLMWGVMYFSVNGVQESKDPIVVSKMSELARSWLRGLSWEGKEVLEEKLRVAKSLLEEVEGLAADLPSTGSSTTT